MNPNLQKITDILQQNEQLSVEERASLAKAVRDTESEMAITAFKLDRTEKVKRTTAILLEETIEELEHKRKEVEAQNRELEIEFSLERVRTVAMGMRKPGDLLSICEILFAELRNMGFGELRNAMINIHNDEKGSFLNYDFSETGGATVTDILYNSHPATESLVKQIRKAEDAFAEIVIDGSELNESREYRKKMRELDDPKLNNVSLLTYYFFSIGTGSIGISTYEPISDEKRNVLKRFRNVFELAYRRFLDVAQAEAQAKEARLELALERVRARTMAMQKSDELGETAFLLFQQFQELGETPDQITIGIIREEARLIEFWITINGNQIDRNVVASVEEPNLMNKLFVAWKGNEKSIVISLSGKQLSDFISYRKEISRHIETPSPGQYSENRRAVHSAFFSKGFITFSSADPKPTETLRLLERFAGVFDQTYTRFLDLQKAEAQAREAQIEAGLERFRSRMLGMQKSSDLEETTTVMHQQMSALGIVPEGAIVSIVLIDKKTDTAIQWIVSDSTLVRPPEGELRSPMNEHPQLIMTYEAWKRKEPLLIRDISGEEMDDFRNYFLSLPSFQKLKSEIDQWPERLVWSEASFSNGTLGLIYTAPLQQPTLDILVRFSKVFDLTYTRFLDIQKAEEQAREAQIQLALERVRARTMAMQRSDELAETAAILFEQFIALGEMPERMAIEIVNEAEHVFEIWATEHGGRQFNSVIKTSLDEPFVMQKMYMAWKERNKSITIDLQGNELEEYFQFLKKMKLPVDRKIFGKRRVQNVATFSRGILTIITPEPRPQETIDILERFAAVFDGTYTRFLDLQKAEEQGREAKIEAALERVRSRSMGIHKSEELVEVVRLLDKETNRLGVEVNGSQILTDFANPEEGVNDWFAVEGQDYLEKFHIPYLEHPLTKKIYNSLHDGVGFYTENYSKVEKNKYFRLLFKYSDFRKEPKERQEFLYHSPGWTRAYVLFKNSLLIFQRFNLKEFTKEEEGILKRFGKVFEQTYTRFLDLQKAEAQAREAQIEAALERVRSRSLAMHKSDELQEVVNTVHASLVELGVKMDSANFNILYDGSRDMDLWIANIYSQRIHVPYLDRKPVRDMMDARDQGITSLQVACTQEQKNIFWKEAFETTGFSVASAERKKFILESKCWTVLWALAKHCGIQLNSYSRDSYTLEEVEITKRFANVFEQAYVRFLDLQKAEAQAKEAQIEASLERVRSKTMAMHNSQDVGDTVSSMLDELVKLGVETNRCGILIYSDTMTAEVWTAKSKPEGKATLTMGQLDLAVHPLLSGIYQAWKNKQPLFTYTMVGKDLVAYYKAINETKYYPTSFEMNTLPSKEFHSDFYFAEGSIFAFTAEPIPAVATMIFKRFAGVFGQTYRRYLDLQKSEANAIEAIRRSSLDRVRAETASMRTTDDLERITPLIWNELTTLGVSFTRCGVFIMDQQQEQIHTFLSTPDGRAIAAFHLPYDTAQTTFQNLVEYWQKRQIYKEHWDESAFINWTRNLVKSGVIAPSEKYVTGDHPTKLDLHFLPFLQGMLYVGNDTPLNDDDLHLVQNLADAFSTAYARYEDFNKLESAKAQIEKTLVDLKQAQAQLVQAEKMASLGELTAGIAHEIQNPLNFVNNFSDVNKELIDEMQQEMDNGNLADAKAISNDIRENEQKINHHGRRADAIVKGMLQHSRSSNGIKEPTDINSLADEYLRLAYHGLRAKDKSFNAIMKTDFDETIGTINIIPQDIGRVILNLITNAFYAVKAPLPPEGGFKDPSIKHEPTIWVTTKKVGDMVLIAVRDNGPGIPKKILDKIFQPFFTTKPTGQGTGLGLSLAYDIVKAHGGELKVETKEGEGSEFFISLHYSTNI